jgi:hypothetical protein
MNAMTTLTFPSQAAQAGWIAPCSRGAVNGQLAGGDHALDVRCIR